jgi:hypothetical protein
MSDAESWLTPGRRGRGKDSQSAGVCLSTLENNGAKRRRTVPESRISKWLFVTAAVAVTTAVTVGAAPTPGRASGGNAPWCAVIDYGDGGVSWECVYRSFEECYPNVIAGNKGSCNVNPYGSGPSVPAAAANRKHRKHQAQR